MITRCRDGTERGPQDKKKAGGSYVTATGILKKFSDTERALILEDGTSIPLMDVTGLDCELLYSWLGDLN